MAMKKTRKINRSYFSIPITLDEVLSALANTDDLPSSSHLAELSDLPPESLLLFAGVWHTLNPGQRREILSMLHTLAEENVELNFDAIFKLGIDDEDFRVRLASIDGLWENRQAWLQRKLINLADQDSSSEVRIAAVQALERFCLDAELSSDEEARKHLSGLLLSIYDNQNESIQLRRRALEAASPLDVAKVRHTIEEAFGCGNREIKVSAIYAMGASSNPCWLPRLIPELQSDDAEIRYEAVRACGEIGQEDVVNWLLPLLEDEDRDVQIASIQALGKIGGSQAREALLAQKESANELLRDSAEQSLYELDIYDDPLSPESMGIGQGED